jgi:hypothetical protein
MDRRLAMLFTASVLLDACGGGGDGGPASTAPGGNASLAPAPAPAPASPEIPRSPNVAAWGDSLTPAYALNLQLLVPDRTLFNGGVIGQTSTQIAARQLAARYPDNYIDMRAWLVSHYDPQNPQDVIDFGNDAVPSSLRYDEIHLRNEGSVLVAQRVKAFIEGKGW